MNPPPPLEWLDAFSKNTYGYKDLHRFNVTPTPKIDDKLGFSLINRPTPYHKAPWMMLVSGSARYRGSQWDNVMNHLGRWLLRYLDNPKLILWIADHGGRLNTSLAGYIDHELDRLYSLEVAEKSEELEKIRTRSPEAIPRPVLRPVWDLILAGKLNSNQEELSLCDWLKKLKRDGLTKTLRLKFRNLLSPKIKIKKPFHFDDNIENLSSSKYLNHLIDWNLILSTDHANHILIDLKEKKYLEEILPDLLPEIQQLLIDALDISRQLGKASKYQDRNNSRFNGLFEIYKVH